MDSSRDIKGLYLLTVFVNNKAGARYPGYQGLGSRRSLSHAIGEYEWCHVAKLVAHDLFRDDMIYLQYKGVDVRC